MQPQNPQNNYDFILNPATPPKKSGLGGNSMAMRALIVVGGLFILVLIAGLLINLLSKSGKAFNEGAVLSVLQDQSELSRLGDLGVESGVSQSVKNAAVTTQLGMKSEQAALLGYLATKGYRPASELLGLKQNAKVDSQLEAAKSSSTFDETYKTALIAELKTYQGDLKAAYDGANNETQVVLSKNFDSADLLLTQLGASN